MSKRKTFMIIIVSILFMIIGTTFAFLKVVQEGNKRQVITASDLQVELEEGEELTIQDAMPMYDEVGKIQKAFEFKVVNQSKNTIDYTLHLVDITNPQVEKLFYEDIKYYLTKNGKNLKLEKLSEREEDKIDTGRVKANESIVYTLRLWIDSEVTANERIEGKIRVFKILAKAAAVTEYEISKTNITGGDISVLAQSEPDKTVTFITTPESGFTYYGAKILDKEGATLQTLSSSQKTFTMPDEEVVIRPMWKKNNMYLLKIDSSPTVTWVLGKHEGYTVNYSLSRNYIYYGGLGNRTDTNARYDFVTNTSIDITHYESLIASGSVYETSASQIYVALGLIPSKSTWTHAGKAVSSVIKQWNEGVSLTSNISSYSGKYYIGVQFCSNFTTGGGEITTIQLKGKLYQ